MESEIHYKQKNLLADTLSLAWKDRSDVYVGNEMAIYFSEIQARHNDFRAPDVFVVLDTTRRVRKSWVVWQEDGRTPDVVIELLSPSTEATDRGEKKRIYSRVLRVSDYFLFDPESGVLEGYRLDPEARQYVRIEPLPGGDLPCRVLGLSLGLRSGRYAGVEMSWLRWLDPGGNVLPSVEEQLRNAEGQLRNAEEQLRSEQTKTRHAEVRAAATEESLARALAEIERLKNNAGR
jgi:Uma2 family endonuclease